eukprot:Pgem_evm1s9328
MLTTVSMRLKRRKSSANKTFAPKPKRDGVRNATEIMEKLSVLKNNEDFVQYFR